MWRVSWSAASSTTRSGAELIRSVSQNYSKFPIASLFLGILVAKAIHVKDPVVIFDFQVTGVLELDRGGEGSARYQALDKWNNQLNNLQKLVINKMA